MWLNIAGVGLLMIGLALDLLNLWWASIPPTKGNQHKSGLFIVPAVLYAGGVFALRVEVSAIARFGFVAAGIFFHGFCYLVAGWVFDKLKGEGVKGSSEVEQEE